jgi:hypothetical protein
MFYDDYDLLRLEVLTDEGNPHFPRDDVPPDRNSDEVAADEP